MTAKRFPDSNVIIVDFRVFNFHVNPIKPTKYGISLVHTEWMKLTEVYKEIDNAQHHMKTVISNILRKMIHVTARAKKDCYGCATDHPSQREHMDSGCLSSWKAKWETYLEECFDNISMNIVL